MNILEELYYGNIVPNEKCAKFDDEVKELLKLLNRNEEKLLEKLCETVDNIKRLDVEPYTKEDICALIIKTVEEHGIEIKHEIVFRAVLADMVSEFCIASVKDAITTADALVHFADFSDFTPTVDESSLKSMITGWHNDAERSEVK